MFRHNLTDNLSYTLVEVMYSHVQITMNIFTLRSVCLVEGRRSLFKDILVTINYFP